MRAEVVETVQKGEFRVYAVETIDEGVEVLTGVAAGKAGADGSYLKGMVNALVSKRLRQMAESMKPFSAS